MNKIEKIAPMLHDKDAAFSHGLAMQDITHHYGGTKSVDGIDLSIAPGELLCLLGPSGCGKSTSLRIAAGLERPSSGEVRIGGTIVADAGQSLPPEQRNVGFLFQDFALFPHLSVRDNVAFGLKHFTPQDRMERVEETLEQVGMAAYPDYYPHMLSGGQQQRVALARALAPRPKLMLLDEPFSGLDARLRDQVRDQTLHVLKNSGVCTLMVTHDPEEAMFMGDRVALMRDGLVVQAGPPEELYCHPVNAFAAEFFGEVNKVEAQVMDGHAQTLLGAIPAPGFAEGDMVQVLVRPEALKLSPLSGEQGSVGNYNAEAQVIASRMLGRSSIVHMNVGERMAPLHLHARSPGRFLPSEGELLEVRLDLGQTFVFPLGQD